MRLELALSAFGVLTVLAAAALLGGSRDERVLAEPRAALTPADREHELATELALEPREAASRSGTARADLVATARARGSIAGAFVDCSGAPMTLESVSVLMLGRDDANELVVAQRSCDWTQASEFSLGDLELGAWKLTFVARGFPHAEHEVLLTRDEPAARFDVRFTERRALRVVVLDELGAIAELEHELHGPPRCRRFEAQLVREPLSAGDVVSTVAKLPGQSCEHARDERGRFLRVRGPRVAPAWVALRHGDEVVACAPVAYASDEVVLSVPRARLAHVFGSIAARLVDERTRAPVVGLSVRVHSACAPRPLELRSDADGRVHFESVPVGSVSLVTSPANHAREWRRGEVVESAPLDFGEILLSRRGRIRGTLAGAPEQASVYAIACTELAATDRSPQWLGGRVYPGGEFHFDDVAVGRWIVTTRMPEGGRFALEAVLRGEHAGALVVEVESEGETRITLPWVAPNAQPSSK